jgi:predicted methyltransferase
MRRTVCPRSRQAAGLSLFALAACATSQRPAGDAARNAGDPGARPDYAAIVAAPDRLEVDRALDPGRHPVEMLSFLQIVPGMRVADIGAASGYTTELLARAVGQSGTVYAQNSKTMVRFVGEAWTGRLARPAMQRVVRVDRELDDPLPPEAKGLDLVVMNAVYHDTIWIGTDRARMNRAIFDALAPGGALVVIDSSARRGAGRDVTYELHRVDEQLVREEVQAAGFQLGGEGDFLRNPADARDWNPAPNEAGARRGTSDRFALRFVKPRA